MRKRNRKGRVTAALLLALALSLSACGKDTSDVQTTPGTSETAKPSESTEPTTKQNVTLPTDTEAVTTVPPTTQDPMELVTEVMYCTAGALNVRTGESTDCEALGSFKEDQEVPVIEKCESGWVKVVWEGRIGYVFAEYLSDDPDWKLHRMSHPEYENGDEVALLDEWVNASFSAVHTGAAVMYRAESNRNNIIVGVNAGHGCSGGGNHKTYSHPDMTPKVTGGTNAAGAVMSTSVSSGMTFRDGTPESRVSLQEARILRDLLLSEGFDVLMIRDGEDVQLDNVARTVICNYVADCHIALHWDGDGRDSDKGCFFMSVPDAMKYMDPVSYTWEKSEALGKCLMKGLGEEGNLIYDYNGIDQDLTQTSYSSVPSVDIELGNQSSDHSEAKLQQLARGLLAGVKAYFECE